MSADGNGTTSANASCGKSMISSWTASGCTTGVSDFLRGAICPEYAPRNSKGGPSYFRPPDPLPATPPRVAPFAAAFGFPALAPFVAPLVAPLVAEDALPPARAPTTVAARGFGRTPTVRGSDRSRKRCAFNASVCTFNNAFAAASPERARVVFSSWYNFRKYALTMSSVAIPHHNPSPNRQRGTV